MKKPMPTKLPFVAAALGAVLLIGALRAQEVIYRRVGPGPMMGEDIGFIAIEGGLGGGKTVTGAPFSATISTQTIQVLADGNRIVRSTTGTFARDAQGRTRRDITLPAIGPWATSGQAPPHAIDINDPVAGAQYILEPNRRIAHQLKERPRKDHKHGEKGRERPDMLGQGPDAADSGVTTTSLGTQAINGVQATGTRYTRVIPAGQIGNEKPIHIVTESWYSPDLQLVVMTKRTDPVRGDSVFQLTNIQRQPPSPTLFQVPSDYTIKQGGPVTIRARGGYRLQPGPEAVPEAMPAPPPPPPDN
jgi:hypothetical protein